MARGIIIAATLCTTLLSFGCRSRTAPDSAVVPVPSGLDSTSLARWVDRQRAACPGHLALLFDEGGQTRDLDSTAGRSTRFRTTLASVQCQRE